MVTNLTALRTYMTEAYKTKWDKPSLTFRQLLRTLYVTKKMPMEAMAKELGVSPHTVNRWLKEAGISSRKMKWL